MNVEHCELGESRVRPGLLFQQVNVGQGLAARLCAFLSVYFKYQEDKPFVFDELSSLFTLTFKVNNLYLLFSSKTQFIYLHFFT